MLDSAEEYTMLKKVINYPNPFDNRGTVFMYDLDRLCDVKIRIFTLAGRLVQELEAGHKYPGYHETYWPAEGMANGTYIYRVTATTWDNEVFRAVGKCVVLK
jgi:hypothetical protein